MSGLSDRLGSRISVISKSQERFEGVLHEIDPKAKTVTLSEGKRSTARLPSYLSTSLLFVVKFHGTENRLVDEAHPTVSVKYAVFDKADLVVFEPLREKTSKTPTVVFPRKSAPLATLTQHRSHVSRERSSRHVGSLTLYEEDLLVTICLQVIVTRSLPSSFEQNS